MGGGGVSGGQKNTAAGNLANTGSMAAANQAFTSAMANRAGTMGTNFYANLAQNGLPFYRNLTDYGSGTVAQAFAPQRADLLRRTDQSTNLPSGYRTALLANLGAQQGRAFDSTLTQAMMANQMAKQQGAAGLQGEQQIAGGQGLSYGGLGVNANNSLLYGPARPTAWGTVGGLAMQGMQTAGDIAKGMQA